MTGYDRDIDKEMERDIYYKVLFIISHVFGLFMVGLVILFLFSKLA